MDFKPKSHEKIRQLIKRGVDIRNPDTVDIGDEVNINRISEKAVRIYPGCRIYGSKTVISSGCKLGYEAPATIEDCQLGANVELKGGFFSKSVFLEKSSMGMGAHVREGCILEEEANGAHGVGLKQTILFPFVTLGSLINFCDCFMAGGTSRSNHSEVGSSFIHFNFTPDADKATPSLIGDVPRGVMLNQPPIFLGGQGGMIGPVRLGYGNVVAAGSILRNDCPQSNQLIFDAPRSTNSRDVIAACYPNFRRIVKNNILYLLNIKALEAWYAHVRKPFFDVQEFGPLIYAAAMDQFNVMTKERLRRLRQMAQKAVAVSAREIKPDSLKERKDLLKKMKNIEVIASEEISDSTILKARKAFIRDVEQYCSTRHNSYIENVQNFPAETAAKGSKWLLKIIDCYCQRISTVIPSLPLI